MIEVRFCSEGCALQQSSGALMIKFHVQYTKCARGKQAVVECDEA